MWIRSQKARAILGLVVTLATLHFLPNRLLVLVVLTISWYVLFSPLSTGELVAFVLAALFFLFQNYVCLKAGLFEFRFKDILLMPYYEPLLWGSYFLSLKRFITGQGKDDLVVDRKSIVGLVVTSIGFSVFSFDSRVLFIATACSTTFLLFLFHTELDVYYALCALAMGFILELFGVTTGLWSYPAPDFLGLPYWFGTMWISVGLLGRRFLWPASEWCATKIDGHLA